jgi:hypothetical protein
MPPTETPTPTETSTPIATETPLPTRTTAPTATKTAEPTPISAKLWDGRYESNEEEDSWVLFRVDDNGETITFAGVVMYNGRGCDVLSHTFNGNQPIEDGRFRFSAGGGGSPQVTLSCTVESESSAYCETNYAAAQLGSCGIGSSRAYWSAFAGAASRMMEHYEGIQLVR